MSNAAIPGWDTVICPACGAEWRNEEPPCVHLDLDQEWPEGEDA